MIAVSYLNEQLMTASAAASSSFLKDTRVDIQPAPTI